MFDEEARKAFEKLKLVLSSPPVLALYDPDAETEVHTDASAVAISGILMQRRIGDKSFHPVHYFSRLTIDAETRYHSFDLECLACVESLRRFRVYLLGKRFKLVTDCSAMNMALQKKEINSRVARWALDLAEFQFDTEHRKAERMQHADALSRALIVDSTAVRVKAVQDDDQRIVEIKRDVERGKTSDYEVDDGVLYKRHEGQKLLVVPSQMAQAIIHSIHERGHFGVRKMRMEFTKQYYIEDFDRRAQSCMRNCIRCLMVERKTGKGEGELRPIPKGDHPMDTWHLDHLGPMTSTSKQYEYILSVVDGFSKFAWLFPCKRTTADESIKKLGVLADVFGYPRKIIVDRGAAFTSKAFVEFCADNGIELHHVTTGAPRGNGQVERVHRIVISSLAKLSHEDPAQWYRHVNRVQRFLNGSYQRAVDATPFKVMFGVEMRSGDDERVEEIIDGEARQTFDEDREKTRQVARRQIQHVQRENQRTYDRNRKPATQYALGEVVFIKKTQFGVGQKLMPKFLGSYRVTECRGRDRYAVEKVDKDSEGPNRTSTSADMMKKGFVGWGSDEASDGSGVAVWDGETGGEDGEESRE